MKYSALHNMKLTLVSLLLSVEAMAAVNKPCNLYTITLSEIEVTSDHEDGSNDNKLIKNAIDTFASSAGSAFSEPEWESADSMRPNPVSHTQGENLSLKVKVKLIPTNLSFDLKGDGPDDYVDFISTGNQSTGQDQIVSVTSGHALPSEVNLLSRGITWTMKVGNETVWCDAGGSYHKIRLTYGEPIGSVPTDKRVHAVCDEAATETSPEAIASALHDAVATSTTFGPSTASGWALLDGGSGVCSDQALTMKLAFMMVGAGNASVKLVRASTNSGAGNCLDLQDRPVGETTQYLLLDSDPGVGYEWNAFQACCEAATKYHSIKPKHKEDNDYDILSSLGWQQYWVELDTPPDGVGWTVVDVIEEVLVP